MSDQSQIERAFRPRRGGDDRTVISSLMDYILTDESSSSILKRGNGMKESRRATFSALSLGNLAFANCKICSAVAVDQAASAPRKRTVRFCLFPNTITSSKSAAMSGEHCHGRVLVSVLLCHGSEAGREIRAECLAHNFPPEPEASTSQYRLEPVDEYSPLHWIEGFS